MSEISIKRAHENEKDAEEDMEPATKKIKSDDVTEEQEKPEIVEKAEKVKSMKKEEAGSLKCEFLSNFWKEMG